MKQLIRPLRRSANSRKQAIASSCSPGAKNSQAHEPSQQRVNIHSTQNATHAPKGCTPIAYSPQESSDVPNALVTTLPATKTIFHPQADTSQKKRQKNDVPMTIYICSISHDIPGISVAT